MSSTLGDDDLYTLSSSLDLQDRNDDDGSSSSSEDGCCSDDDGMCAEDVARVRAMSHIASTPKKWQRVAAAAVKPKR